MNYRFNTKEYVEEQLRAGRFEIQLTGDIPGWRPVNGELRENLIVDIMAGDLNPAISAAAVSGRAIQFVDIERKITIRWAPSSVH